LQRDDRTSFNSKLIRKTLDMRKRLQKKVFT